MHIVTLNSSVREDWLRQLADVITDPDELLHFLSLQHCPELSLGYNARRLFSLRVPRSFAARMKKGDPNDPLLLQVVTSHQEFMHVKGYSNDPLNEQNNAIPNLLHKYHNRALLLVKSSCAVNCRYCFRRHFPYQDNQGNKRNWMHALTYIQNHQELDEIIFSGGDPLMAKDYELEWLINALEHIPHIKRLRIHTRLPVVIPQRITIKLCQILNKSRLQILVVTHINHQQEINSELHDAIHRLKQSGVTLLNQSVLLNGINDDAVTLSKLSHALFDAGILPYYLHILDKVQGTAHFYVSDTKIRIIMHALLGMVSGYLVPKLVREVAGSPSKILLDLKLI